LTPPPPTPAIPGDSVARPAKFRPASGSVSSVLRVTVVPSVFRVVSTSGDSPVTVTVSDTVATCRVMLTVASWPVVNVNPLRTWVAKPASSTRIS
jgi:hypothetical protein